MPIVFVACDLVRACEKIKTEPPILAAFVIPK